MKYFTRARIMLILCTLTLVVSLSISVFTFASGNHVNWNSTSGNLLNRENEAPPVYPVNQYGLTYGSAAEAFSYETEPDLIAAIGVDGIEGYVYAEDLRGPMPNSPEEASALMEARGSEPRSIPLYEKDGKTVIGEFLIYPPGETRIFE